MMMKAKILHSCKFTQVSDGWFKSQTKKWVSHCFIRLHDYMHIKIMQNISMLPWGKSKKQCLLTFSFGNITMIWYKIVFILSNNSYTWERPSAMRVRAAQIWPELNYTRCVCETPQIYDMILMYYQLSSLKNTLFEMMGEVLNSWLHGHTNLFKTNMNNRLKF